MTIIKLCESCKAKNICTVHKRISKIEEEIDFNKEEITFIFDCKASSTGWLLGIPAGYRDTFDHCKTCVYKSICIHQEDENLVSDINSILSKFKDIEVNCNAYSNYK